MTDKTLSVRVECENLPGLRFVDTDGDGEVKEPVYLGVQNGKDMVAAVPADSQGAIFSISFKVSEKKDGSPNFLGPYAQGKPADRFFIYAGR